MFFSHAGTVEPAPKLLRCSDESDAGQMWCLRFEMESINRVAPTYRLVIASHGENHFCSPFVESIPSSISHQTLGTTARKTTVDRWKRLQVWFMISSRHFQITIFGIILLLYYYFYYYYYHFYLFITPLKSHGPLEANIFSQIASQVDTWERWGLSLLDSCSPLIATKQNLVIDLVFWGQQAAKREERHSSIFITDASLFWDLACLCGCHYSDLRKSLLCFTKPAVWARWAASRLCWWSNSTFILTPSK